MAPEDESQPLDDDGGLPDADCERPDEGFSLETGEATGASRVTSSIVGRAASHDGHESAGAGASAPQIFRAVGCEKCEYQGYNGRQSILELLKIDPGIDELIARRATAREILTAARASGFKTLADDGVRLVRAGTTSLDELMRVVDLTDRMA